MIVNVYSTFSTSGIISFELKLSFQLLFNDLGTSYIVESCFDN